MKSKMRYALLPLALLASKTAAETILNIDGEDYTLSALMENCQAMADDPAAQIACFNAVSAAVAAQQQPAEVEPNRTDAITAALENLRRVTQYQDEGSGLIIQGSECNLQIIYYANYFHISRRNVSSIDVLIAQFDMAGLAYSQTVQVSPENPLLSKGVMQAGASATTIGGFALESAQDGFTPKSARATIAEYAVEVINQLPSRQGSAFDFVLVHPAKQQDSLEIWDAFQKYNEACKN